MQSLARGVSSRTRVKLLRNLQQAVDIEQQLTVVEAVEEPEVMPPVVEAPPPVVAEVIQPTAKPSPPRRRIPPRAPPTQPPAHNFELKIFKMINGTELEITGAFVTENSTGSSSQVVCQLIARDKQDNLESMLSINAADVTAISRTILDNDHPQLESILLLSSEPSDDAVTNHSIREAVFLRLCDGLECFISRKNQVMTIKYHVA